jgi:hypothetical protein
MLHKYGCRVVLEFFFVASTLADKASTWSKEKTRRYPTVKIELAASVYYEHIPHHTTRKPDGSIIIARVPSMRCIAITTDIEKSLYN